MEEFEVSYSLDNEQQFWDGRFLLHEDTTIFGMETNAN
jgi:hypothetical protein